MAPKLPRASRCAIVLSPRARRAIKRQTARYVRRASRRDPLTHLGLDARSRTIGWVD